jgi:hypothetical protein
VAGLTRRRTGEPVTCSRCGLLKGAGEFYEGKRQCVECRNRYQREVVNPRGRYGITAQEADAILYHQGGTCLICGDGPLVRWPPAWRKGGTAVIDHDHETGEIRGVLCGRCNVALGWFRHDPKRLRAAAEYLERPRRVLGQ